MSERWRCFVALPIADEARRALAAAVASWRERPELEGARWTEPVGWHVTLVFLGSVPSDGVGDVVGKVRRIAAGHQAMALAGDGIGAFPSPRRASVLWYGILDPDGRVQRLAHDLRAGLGTDTDQHFRAHLTLARARRQPIDLAGFVASAPVPPTAFRVDRVELMRSHLGRSARYEVVESAPLGGSVHV
jgi:RNA 2',3'-cyclic 3'-phosphodiesterase